MLTSPYPETRHLFTDDWFAVLGIKTIPRDIDPKFLTQSQHEDLKMLKESQQEWWLAEKEWRKAKIARQIEAYLYGMPDDDTKYSPEQMA